MDNVTERPEPDRVQQDWKAEATRLAAEARFWRTKYFEALKYSQSQSQVIAMLGLPQMQQDAKAQSDHLARVMNS